MQIGIAGTGKMGTAIAGRLISLGHEVFVWNRTASNAAAAVGLGAKLVSSPHDLVESSEVVIGLLTDEAALDQVYGGAQGLLSGAVNGKTLIEMSTVSPAKQIELGQRVQAAGGRYIECPVGGSIGPAKEGKLLGFVGGAAEDVAQVRPLLDQICRRVEHVGPHGSGAMMKLAINLPLMVYWQTLAEALSLIQPLGLDPKRVIDIFSETSGGPNVLKSRGSLVAQTLIDGQASNVNVTVGNLRKDLRSMIAQASTMGVQLPLAQESLNRFDATAKAGLDGTDASEHLVYWLNQKS